jgi:hypothetical protein
MRFMIEKPFIICSSGYVVKRIARIGNRMGLTFLSVIVVKLDVPLKQKVEPKGKHDV